jgi:hypothetical protein
VGVGDRQGLVGGPVCHGRLNLLWIRPQTLCRGWTAEMRTTGLAWILLAGATEAFLAPPVRPLRSM